MLGKARGEMQEQHRQHVLEVTDIRSRNINRMCQQARQIVGMCQQARQIVGHIGDAKKARKSQSRHKYQ